VFDLSFVPDDMSFDDDPRLVQPFVNYRFSSHDSRDETAEDQLSGYKGIDFVTTVRKYSSSVLCHKAD
jgi:hypothetical protein